MAIYKVIVNNDKDYKQLSPHAYYKSDRTKVMCFDMDPLDDHFHIIAKYFKDSDDETTKENRMYQVSYNNGIYIQAQDHELACYLDSWVKNGYIKVSVVNWWKVALLLMDSVLLPEQSFKARFIEATKKTNINQMKNWSMKVKFRRPDWTFKECAKKSLNIDGETGLQIGSCKFLKDSKVQRNYTVVSGYIGEISSDNKKILFKDNDGNIYNLQIKGYPYHFNKEAWKKDKLLSLYYSGTSTEVYNPTLIPAMLNLKSPEDINDYLNRFGYLSNRSCPTELLNRLKAEVIFSLTLGGDKL